MPEIKRTFHAGKMNKDLDERLVQNGEYRDAMNIQVQTTDDPDGDGGEAGTVQNLKGNSLIGQFYYDDWHSGGTPLNPLFPRCVGSVTDEKNNKAYFFFASPLDPPNWGVSAGSQSSSDTFLQRRLYVDAIVEQGLNGQTIPVVVDVFGVVDRIVNVVDAGGALDESDPSITAQFPQSGWSTIRTLDASSYKPGMEIRIVNEDGVNVLNQSPLKIKAIDGNHILLHEPCYQALNGGDWFVFQSERVLNFSPGNFLVEQLDNNNLKANNHYITGINIIDGMIFWTDNYSEPKKINIKRCKAGTNILGVNNNYNKSTKLYIKDAVSGQYVDANTTDFELDTNASELKNGSGIDSYLKEEHITVIKQSPKSPPTLIMSSGVRPGTSTFITDYVFHGKDDSDPTLIKTGDSFSITNNSLLNTNFKKNDILTFTSQAEIGEQEVVMQLRVRFEAYQLAQGEELVDALSTTDIIKFKIITGGQVNQLHGSWAIDLELKEKPLFETTFGRFGYRYKYSDGEYSTFSPWSELAFLPGNFSYKTDDGYNLGMVNTIRSLKIKDFIPYRKPLDIIAVDILYKTTDSPNIHVVETVEKGRNSEWNKFTPDGTSFTKVINTGLLEITTEMIHRTLPSNQVLRSWDNVPRYAKAQEIVGNRLLYGNYTQGYNINNVNVNLRQDVVSESIDGLNPAMSVKSMRDYKIGMVFGDKYGRETPVITSGYTVSDITDEGYTTMTGDISVPKSLSANKNSFIVTQNWGDPNFEIIPPTIKDGGWIDYVKYFVKETSNEYYNLVMDRWYYSGDERDDSGYNNIWLSFNSADRNKVDDETYLILKNSNGNDTPVFAPAKYKILAIENEAPDFIKTKKVTIGIVRASPAVTYLSMWQSYTDDDETGDPPTGLWTNAHIDIHYSSWEDAGMGDISGESGGLNEAGIFGKRIEGQLQVRVLGRCIQSGIVTGEVSTPWKDVVNWGGENNQKAILRWANPWEEEEANLYQQVADLDATEVEGYNLANLEYYIELRDSIIENKPEFEGKFFVKVKQDQYTSQNIEFSSVPSVTVNTSFNTVGSQFKMKYIRSSQISGTTNTIQSGIPANEGFYEFDFNQEPPPPYNTVTNNNPNHATNTPLFYGAFHEFLLPNIPDGETSWFDNAAATTTGPGETDAADPTANPDGADDCACVTEFEDPNYGVAPPWPVSPFGACSVNYSTMTRNFWKEFNDESYSSTPNASPIFLDECQMAYMSIIPGPHRELLGRTTGTEPGDLPPVGGPENTVPGWENGKYARPRSAMMSGQGKVLGITGTSDGSFGMVCFSYVSNSPDQNSSVANGWDKLKTPGSIFRGMGVEDGVSLYFQVMGVMYQSDPNGNHTTAQKNFSGSWDDDAQEITYPASGINSSNDCNWYGSGEGADADYRYRHTIYVEIRRLDEFGQVTTLGVPTNKDPRGNRRHDGKVDLRFQYATVEVSAISSSADALGEAVNPIASTNGAVFETEPKKSADIDIYYEASAALPMVLNKDNVFDFIPINSRVSAIRTQKGDEKEVEMVDARVNRRVNNAHFLHDYKEHAIVSIVSDDAVVVEEVVDEETVFNESATFGQSFLHRRDFTIGDKLKFEHSDGTVTQAIIKQMYKPIVPDGYGFSQLTSDDIQYGIISGPKAFEHAGTITKTMYAVHSANDWLYGAVPSGQFASQLSFFTDIHNIPGQTDPAASGEPCGPNSSQGPCIEIGDVIKSITYTKEVGGTQVLYTVGGSTNPNAGSYFGQTEDHVAPRGVQVVGFEAGPNDVEWRVKLSPIGNKTIDDGSGNLTQVELWSDVLEGIDVSPNSLAGGDMTVVLQKNYGYYGLDVNVWKQPTKLGWKNCVSYGNGLESNRIRDDFNAPKIDNGVSVSTTFSGYKRENISSGLIYSGLYNSKSQVNNLNQFNMAEKITKDLNPSYGSIQRLKTRDTDVIVFAEDKILKVLANKDALYNADGNPQLTATDRVLGTAVPYVGDFGISKNPESLAWDQFRMYFTDRQRSAVLRLSQDGLTPISEMGMSTWFKNELKKSKSLLGSFDAVSGEYNLTITPPYYHNPKSKTISFNETTKGWVSFKSFTPQNGVSYGGDYVTVKDHQIWKHHSNKTLSGQVVDRNSFYGKEPVNSSVQVIFNDSPGSIKSFKTINYEGSQAKIQKHTSIIKDVFTGTVAFQESQGIMQPYQAETLSASFDDGEYYNLTSKDGWWIPGMYTDIQQGQVGEFKNKEGKWFSRVSGLESNSNNLDTNEFTVQGVGMTSGYLYTGVSVNPCVSGCLDSDYNCIECADPTLNDQCTNMSGDVVNCNAPDCVAGPCITPPIAVYGCTNPNAVNHNPSATHDDGSCAYSIAGCMEYDNPNYNPLATIPNPYDCDGNVVTGCMDPLAMNYEPTATQDGITTPEYNPYFGEIINTFTPCYNFCSCTYAINNSVPECEPNGMCICPECCNSTTHTWNPDLQFCVANDWNEVCSDVLGGVVPCTSSECVSGACVTVDEEGGGESGCTYGGPDCCGPSQAWSEFHQSCEDIVVGCMDINALNYMGPILDYQWPNNTASGHANINGITYDGNHPDTGNPHPAYNPANSACYSWVTINGMSQTVPHSCCEYYVPPPKVGCMDPDACNYDETANQESGNCEYTSCAGCMDPYAFNYDPNVIYPCYDSDGVIDGYGGGCCDDTCGGDDNCYGCQDPEANNTCVACFYHDQSKCTYDVIVEPDPEENCGEGTVWDEDTQTCIADPTPPLWCDCENETPSGTNPYPCYGCTDPSATNWCECCTINAINPMEINADVDPCVYAIQDIYGCMDSSAFNYNPNANTFSDASEHACIPVIEGCMDPDMVNYQEPTGDPYVDVNTPCADCCEGVIPGCTDQTMSNYNPFANTDNGLCVPFVYGCLDPNAENYCDNCTHDEYYNWNPDTWDGTAAGILENWISGITPCSGCYCSYPDPPEIGVMNIMNNTEDSVAVIDYETNPWLLDPDSTEAQEGFYEAGVEPDDL